ncbi:flagellar hook-basal body complex protein FliE [Pseudomonadota bacterium]
MNTVDVNQVLTQMRRLESLAKNEAMPVEQGQSADFSALLKQSIDKVNETQQTAGELKTAFETGSRDVDLAEVMIAVQKSSVSFQAMVQVRNKLVEAYKDVMSMPI